MLDQKSLNKLLFIDIETTSQKETFSELTKHQQDLFKNRFKKDIEMQIQNKLSVLKVFDSENVNDSEETKKATKKKKNILTPEKIIENVKNDIAQELYDTKGPIHCEWNKILCISCGVLWKNNENDSFYNIKILSFYGEDEKKLLLDFVNHPKLGPILNKIPGKFDKNREDFWALVGHNISVFDLPVISKRMIINEIKPPKMFDVSHLKSWDLNDVIIDTKSVWSYNVFDNSTSLDLLCEIFNVPSSKDEISGADVKNVFYKEKDLNKIVKYCEKDVVALAQVYLKMKSMTEEVRVYIPPTQPSASEEKKETSV
jgi:hypothetical protein